MKDIADNEVGAPDPAYTLKDFPSLSAKLAWIMDHVGAIKKNGYNAHFRYHYMTEDDLLTSIRPLLSRMKIMVFPEVKEHKIEVVTNEKGEKGYLTSLVMQYTIVDGDTKEERKISMPGFAVKRDDKGLYSCITGANKYAFMKLFCVSTQDDPEGPEDDDFRPGEANQRPEQKLEELKKRTGMITGTELEKRSPVLSEAKRVPEEDKIGRPPEGSPADERWRQVVIHFGQDKGKKLTELDDEDLIWRINNYSPKPYQGKMNQQDAELRKALNEARVYLESVGISTERE
jgi:hypothetical protein